MEQNAHIDLCFPDEDHNGSSSIMTSSQSGTRPRIATWYKDAAVNSTDDPPFPPSLMLRVYRKKTEQEIDNLRRVLAVARKETHGAFQKFTQAWDAELKAQPALAAAEHRRGEL